jgi:hypothetical protein
MTVDSRPSVTWKDVRNATAYRDVEHLVGRLAPAPDSDPTDFAAYYQRAAAEFDRIARDDPSHQHEAQADASTARKYEAINRAKAVASR